MCNPRVAFPQSQPPPPLVAAHPSHQLVEDVEGPLTGSVDHDARLLEKIGLNGGRGGEGGGRVW
jgi:hypothetical protein